MSSWGHGYGGSYGPPPLSNSFSTPTFSPSDFMPGGPRDYAGAGQHYGPPTDLGQDTASALMNLIGSIQGPPPRRYEEPPPLYEDRYAPPVDFSPRRSEFSRPPPDFIRAPPMEFDDRRRRPEPPLAFEPPPRFAPPPPDRRSGPPPPGSFRDFGPPPPWAQMPMEVGPAGRGKRLPPGPNIKKCTTCDMAIPGNSWQSHEQGKKHQAAKAAKAAAKVAAKAEAKAEKAEAKAEKAEAKAEKAEAKAEKAEAQAECAGEAKPPKDKKIRARDDPNREVDITKVTSTTVDVKGVTKGTTALDDPVRVLTGFLYAKQFPAPTFEYTHSIQSGWNCAVSVGKNRFKSDCSVQLLKAEAKVFACQKALESLGAPHHVVAPCAATRDRMLTASALRTIDLLKRNEKIRLKIESAKAALAAKAASNDSSAVASNQEASLAAPAAADEEAGDEDEAADAE